jgi:hypothetical protein
MKAFYITNGLPGLYGDRVFLPADVVREMLEDTCCFSDQLPHDPKHPIAKVLRENCIWGGSDKYFDGWYGYEVSITEEGQKQMENIVKVLVGEGFERLSSRPWR